MRPKTDNSENSIYFHSSSSNTSGGFVSGVTGVWVVGNIIAGNESKSFSIYNPNLQTTNFKLDINGHCLLTNNLTVNGSLQSSMTNLLTLSSSRALTRNETV